MKTIKLIYEDDECPKHNRSLGWRVTDFGKLEQALKYLSLAMSYYLIHGVKVSELEK